MFMAALYTIANIWKQPKCPSAEEWIKKMWCVCVCVYIYIYIYIYNGILIRHKKEGKFAICSNMDGLRGHYAK